jgi:glycosyltransferase involved in cell wall biosynthesis
VSTNDLVAIYNLATVYCQPSFDEGFGLPVLEAMACGCPVVSSDRGSLPEVVGDAGLLVNPSVKGLSLGLKRVLGDVVLRRKLSGLGAKRVKGFSWEKTARETYRVYQSLFNKQHF